MPRTIGDLVCHCAGSPCNTPEPKEYHILVLRWASGFCRPWCSGAVISADFGPRKLLAKGTLDIPGHCFPSRPPTFFMFLVLSTLLGIAFTPWTTSTLDVPTRFGGLRGTWQYQFSTLNYPGAKEPPFSKLPISPNGPWAIFLYTHVPPANC